MKFVLTVMFSLLVGACSNTSSPELIGTDQASATHYRVYSAILNWHADQGDFTHVYISSRAYRKSPLLRLVFRDLVVPKLDSNSVHVIQPLVLEISDTTLPDWTLIERFEVRMLYEVTDSLMSPTEDQNAWWREYHCKYPGGFGIFSFSPVAISGDGLTAAVAGFYSCGTLCASWDLYVLKRLPFEGWQVDRIENCGVS